MNTQQNITDDPRLTAYALGELKGAERDGIERFIARSTAAKAEVEAIRQLAGALTYELAGELPRAETPTVTRVARPEHGRDGRGSRTDGWQPRTSRLRRKLSMAAAATTVAGIVVAVAIAARHDFAPPSKSHAGLSDASVAQAPASAAPESADVQQQQLASLVEQFNALVEAHRFDEAHAIAEQAEQLSPNSGVGKQMKWTLGMVSKMANPQYGTEPKADGFVTNILESVEQSSVPADDRTPRSVRNVAGTSIPKPAPPAEPSSSRATTNAPAAPVPPAPSYPSTADAYSPGAAPQYPTTSPQPGAASMPAMGYGTPATGYAATSPGVAVGGAAPASGADFPQPTGIPAGPVPASAQTAAPCCAPCSQGYASGNGQNPPFMVFGKPSVPCTICKPTYQVGGRGLSRFSVGRANAAATAASQQENGVDVVYGNWPTQRATTIEAESYAPITENDFLSPLKEPLSTFSADVDTGSYSNIRRFLEQGQLPPADAVRIEEMLNYFSYDYAPPADGKPFAVHVETAACPWNAKHRLARIAIKGREVPRDKRPPSNLVFLVDVSGSMDEPNKLPLVKASLAMIIESLNENDRVAIVTYAGSVQRVLDSTPGNKRSQIMAAISALGAGGSTNGEGGIQMAYETAAKGFRKGGTNRIILCTDGDFNVGVSDDGQLVKLIEEKRQSGVFLSIFGFGMGNLKDAKLEKLADHGNGQYGYIDSRQEARKVFVEGLSGTLVTIAKDVKLQVEFNPAQVGAYRLIGYENRALAAEDFNNDAKDAGDIGAGHNVTALYEIVPAGEMKASVDPLKYQGQPVTASAKAADKPASDELFTLKLRYKQPDGETSQKMEIPCKDRPDASAHPSRDFDWAAGVAVFGMLLRDSKHKGVATFDLALELAQGGKGKDVHGYRAECIELMRKAKGLKQPPQPATTSAGPGK